MLFSPQIAFFWEGTWPGDHVEPRRRLYETEFIYVSEGEYTLYLDSEPHAMHRGSIAVIPPNTWHESRTAPTQSTRRHCIHFQWLPEPPGPPKPIQCFYGEPYDYERMSPVPKEILKHLPLVSPAEAHPEALPVIEQALPLIRQRQAMGCHLLWPVLNLLLQQHHGQAMPGNFPSKTARAVLMVRDYIDAHYAEPQDYTTYTSLARLSASHLCQGFKKLVGRPPLTYLNDLRLHHARRLLRESAMNVSEIAAAVGVPDANYFSRLFRKKFQQSPTQYLAAERHAD